jgi:voltage-gated potassium channel
MEITDSEFQDYGIIWNGQWLTVVSMSTVGFGDFYPVTALGRITIIVAIYFGAWIFALLQDLKI